MKKPWFVFILLLITITVSCQIIEKENIDNINSYILTPEPSPKPKINGAKVFGVHPGNPVIFTIPVTGNRPMTFTAKNLPEGLRLDMLSRRFSGSIETLGTYTIRIFVKNESGADERDFRIVVGEKLALTPTWSTISENVS